MATTPTNSSTASTPIPAWPASSPLTSDQVAASAQFIQFLRNLVQAISDNINSLQSQATTLQNQEALLNSAVQGVQVAQAQLTTQLGLINMALSGSPATGQSMTQATNVDLTTTNVWQQGAVIDFPAAVSTTNQDISQSGPTNGGSTTGMATMTGNARLQKIVSGVETNISNGTFTITAAVPARGGDPAIPAMLSFSGWSPLPGADTTTGDIKYRVDLERTGGCTSVGVGVTTSVHRV